MAGTEKTETTSDTGSAAAEKVPRWRRILCGVLVVLVCILAPVSLLAVWTRNTLPEHGPVRGDHRAPRRGLRHPAGDRRPARGRAHEQRRPRSGGQGRAPGAGVVRRSVRRAGDRAVRARRVAPAPRVRSVPDLVGAGEPAACTARSSPSSQATRVGESRRRTVRSSCSSGRSCRPSRRSSPAWGSTSSAAAAANACAGSSCCSSRRS